MANMQAIREELEHVRSQDDEGKLHPKSVWEYARDNECETAAWMREQGVFDPEKAQEKLGLILARELIVKVKIVIDQQNSKPPVRIREYQSLQADRRNGGGYRNISAVMSDEDLREQMLETALAELQSLKIRFGALTELSEVFSAVDSVNLQEDEPARASA